MASIQKILAANMRKYRKAARLSQEKLAELAGLHRTYIGGIEQCRVNVSLKNIGKIATALNVDPALLLLSDEDVVSSEVADRRQSMTRFAKPLGAAEIASGRKGDSPPDYALVSWHNGRMVMRPLDVAYEDLTVQVLCDLVLKGYRGSDLAAHYSDVHFEIMSFLEAEDTPEAT